MLLRAPAAPTRAGAGRGAPRAPEAPTARDGRTAAAGRAPACTRPPARGGVPAWVWLASGGLLLSFLLCGSLASGLTLRSFVFRETSPAAAQHGAAPADGQPGAAPLQAAAGGPAKDAAPGKPTMENFAKIKPGMTEAEVKALLGEPTQVSDSKQLAPLLPLIGKEAGDDPKMRILVWKPGRGQIFVGFMGDKLTLSSATLPGERGEGAARPGAVTEENFGKLKYGMSQADVR
jgi:hypothetical protein